jgi:hypothetical protein
MSAEKSRVRKAEPERMGEIAELYNSDMQETKQYKTTH